MFKPRLAPTIRPHVLVSISCAALLLASPSLAADPVSAFIAAADSIARSGGEDALARYVAAEAILAGAAVHQVLDAALKLGDQGQPKAERENVLFAERLARLYRDRTGSSALLDLVRTYRGWNAEQRAMRRRAEELENRSVDARSAKDYGKAARLLREANDIYRRIGDRYSEAVVYGSLGVVHWYAGDFEAVRKSYEKALAARRAIENRILEGRTLNGLGSTYMILERFDEAIDRFRGAVELRRRTRDLAGLGTSLTYLGNAYQRVGRLGEAREAYEEALSILDATGTPRQRAELLNSTAILCTRMGRIARSNEAYRRALEIALAEGDRGMELVCRMNIAINLGNTLRYRDALREFSLVEALLEENPDALQSILLHQNRGVVNLKLGDLEAARDDFLAALKLSKEQGSAGSEMNALINLGYLYRELGAYDLALAAADTALFRAQRSGDAAAGREAHELAADIERIAGRYEASLEHWYRALDIDRKTRAETNVLKDGLGIANINALMGNTAEARSVYEGLVPRVREAGAEDLELAIWFGIGHTFERSNFDSARFYYDRALSVIERARAGIADAEIGSRYLGGERRYFFEEIARFYGRAARETGDERWSSLAFRTMESAKARGLLDLMEGSLADEHSPEEEAVLDSLARLDPGAPGCADARRRLERRHRALRDRRLSASAAALAPIDLIADIGEVQRSLPKKTAMLVYALGDSASLLWVIDRKNFEMHELPRRSLLAGNIDLLKSALASPGAGDAELRRLARKLYRALVEPAAKRIGRSKHLVIVPDGRLFELPFEALLSDDAKEAAEWKSLPFVARRHAVAYAPSASIYLKLREPRREAEYDLDLLAVGDPDYAACRGGGDHSLGLLPHARAEIDAIGSHFKREKTSLLVGSAAGEAALKAELRSRRARFLHVAAHGLVDPANPSLSGIALCPDSLGREDGYLRALEILELPANVRLVVLSACESARGRIGRSEGVAGLGRAFIAAGAGGVVASLWPVSDVSTSRLMQEFYERMAGKKEPACVALNKARMALLEDSAYAHPFFWSAFIVVGTDRSPW